MDNLRIGKFRLPYFDIIIQKNYVKIIHSNIVVVKAEFIPYPDCVEYTAISNLFDPLKKGEIVPLYYVVVNSNNEMKVRHADI
jgi:hypothetical protein